MLKHTNLQQMCENILSDVQDLEDIVSSAKQLTACPYYASRLSLNEAEIVILPYNILLHKGTRNSFGINLKNSIVIVDEAHNLLETLTSVYSVEIRLAHLEILNSQITRYMTKYNTRFNPLNLMYLKQLIFVLKKLIAILSESSDEISLSYDPLDFVLKLGIEHINIYKLVDFIDKSHIASKLHMFSLKPQKDSDNLKKAKISGTKSFLSKFKNTTTELALVNGPNSSVNTDNCQMEDNLLPEAYFNSNMVYSLKELLLSLKDFGVDGKILLNLNKTAPSDSTCKYFLLNSSSHFKVNHWIFVLLHLCLPKFCLIGHFARLSVCNSLWRYYEAI